MDLDESFAFDELPSRSVEDVLDTRTEFYLAVLDERTIFTADQRESLRPLVRLYMADEYKSTSRYRPVRPQIPNTFGLADDGVVSETGNAMDYLNTRQRAQVKTLRESCTQQQRDVIDV